MKNQPFLLFLVLTCAVANASFAAPACDASLTATSTNSRYIPQKDGTVVDKQTGLTWMRCALGQTWSENGCKGLPQMYSWKNAQQVAENSSFANQGGWRLPNQEELLSLLENRCYRPFVNLVAFPNPTDHWFWSSSANPSNGGGAFMLNFFSDYDKFGNKNDSYAVRLVRGEEL